MQRFSLRGHHPNAAAISVMLLVLAFATMPIAFEAHREMKATEPTADPTARRTTVTLTCFDQNMVASACDVVERVGAK